jgi:hypothetical protein
MWLARTPGFSVLESLLHAFEGGSRQRLHVVSVMP